MEAEDREADRVLVERCLAGDPEAWRGLTTRFTPSLSRKIRWVLTRFAGGDPGPDLDEVLQNVFLRISENSCRILRDFQWRCSLETYLKTVASACAIRYLQREGRAGRRWGRRFDVSEMTEILPADEPDSLTISVGLEEQERVRQALLGLSPRDRLAVRLYYWKGASPTEIARILETTPAYVCVILDRARGKIRRNWGKA